MESLTPLQHNTLNILVKETSAAKPIPNIYLAKRIGMPTGKQLAGADMRSIIHALRVKNFPICANTRGYFYARNDDELSKFIVKMQERVIAQEDALKGLKESFHNVGSVSQVKERPLTVRRVVRLPNGNAAYRDLKVGPDGNPIVPEGVELL